MPRLPVPLARQRLAPGKAEGAAGRHPQAGAQGDIRRLVPPARGVRPQAEAPRHRVVALLRLLQRQRLFLAARAGPGSPTGSSRAPAAPPPPARVPGAPAHSFALQPPPPGRRAQATARRRPHAAPSRRRRPGSGAALSPVIPDGAKTPAPDPSPGRSGVRAVEVSAGLPRAPQGPCVPARGRGPARAGTTCRDPDRNAVPADRIALRQTRLSRARPFTRSTGYIEDAATVPEVVRH